MKRVMGPNPEHLKLIEILKRDNDSIIGEIRFFCGGSGICGKCRVLVNGKIELACQYVPTEGDLIETIVTETPGIEASVRFDLKENNSEGFSCAVDLGTTTVVCALLNKAEIIDTVSQMNCQKIWGADVISRMSYACSGEDEKNIIQEAIRKQIYDMCELLTKRNRVEKLKQIVIAANTAMTKILLGENCSKLIKAPFIGQSNGYKGTVDGVEVTVLPCSYAFFGSDLSVGMYASGFYDVEKPALYIDAGTNGEIALATENGLFLTSSAAGPAFETAVESGLYGSEIINELARCLKENLIDETGRIEKMNTPFTQKEIRSIQLAKGAIAASVSCLLQRAGLMEEELKNVFLAGGFGSALNIENAIKIGLLPNIGCNIFKGLGNASLGGACTIAGNPEKAEEAVKKTAQGCYIELFSDKSFNDMFADKMMF